MDTTLSGLHKKWAISMYIFPDDSFCGTSIEATLLMYMFASTYSYTSNFQATIYWYTS